MAYGEALALQRDLAQRRIDRSLDHDLLLLVEHPPVVTLGRGSHAEHLVAPKEFLAAKGVELFEVERGGDVTCHGPGQLVGYPIYDLTQHRRDLHWFLRALEECLIAALRDFGVAGERRDGYTGVWTGGRKIASIGIHVKQWVTWHGFALNVMTDLSLFDLIVPCGIPDVAMTSIQKELGERSPRDLWGRALDAVVLAFCEVFRQQAQMVELEAVRSGA
ncbi:MAG: lipoyl(octanoyl) transferase LipB [Gemmatimonadetes bacterium]|nr:lipoyl(octanoyl) transferase LipB [Gemmatimonadota bacterium]MBI2403256.1 lipoyl(octanoyl) transferase LipB [Gemmatimonadota bacterium]